MNFFSIILVSIFVLTGGIFAQTDERQVCPKLGVTGPSGIVAPGDTATYTAHVDSAGPDLRYQWSISAGQIIAGQGTPTITVKHLISGAVATVEIIGLPKGCPNMASEPVSWDNPEPKPELLYTFPGPITAKDKTRFNKVYDRLEADPNARGVILLCSPSVREMEANKKIIRSFIKTLRKDPLRVTFVTGTGEDDLAAFWIVPSGAAEPVMRCS